MLVLVYFIYLSLIFIIVCGCSTASSILLRCSEDTVASVCVFSTKCFESAISDTVEFPIFPGCIPQAISPLITYGDTAKTSLLPTYIGYFAAYSLWESNVAKNSSFFALFSHHIVHVSFSAQECSVPYFVERSFWALVLSFLFQHSLPVSKLVLGNNPGNFGENISLSITINWVLSTFGDGISLR